MTMTNEEICRDYRAAKAPQKQIGILAELNQCDKERIKCILIEGGEKLPGNMTPKKRPAIEVATEPTKAEPERMEVLAPEALRLRATAARCIRARILRSTLDDEDMMPFAEFCRGVVAMWEAME